MKSRSRCCRRWPELGSGPWIEFERIEFKTAKMGGSVPRAFSHQPADYQCPFCVTVRGEDCEGNWTRQTDVVYRDSMVTAWINAAFWPANPGAVVVIPNAHYENVY